MNCSLTRQIVTMLLEIAIISQKLKWIEQLWRVLANMDLSTYLSVGSMIGVLGDLSFLQQKWMLVFVP